MDSLVREDEGNAPADYEDISASKFAMMHTVPEVREGEPFSSIGLSHPLTPLRTELPRQSQKGCVLDCALGLIHQPQRALTTLAGH